MDITDFPGCCGVDVVCNLNEAVSNPEDTRDILYPGDFGYVTAATRELQASLDASLNFATTSSENHPDNLVVLEKAGFQRLLTFRNSKTDNIVTVWTRGRVKLVSGEITAQKPRSAQKRGKK